uniref:Histone deacetylase domain-containing protein n=1 Tax=Meloidogyne javanica TaxID=6303 RepID=A0A915N2C0_MELJA
MDFYNEQIYPKDGPAKKSISRAIPLRIGTSDEYYLSRLERELNEAFSEFIPNLVVYVAGTDSLSGDPLGLLRISSEGIIRRDELVFKATKQQFSRPTSALAWCDGILAGRFDNSEPVHWPKGLHVFSNSPRITPFKKAVYGEKLLQSLIDQFSTKIDFTEEDLINELFKIGSNTEIHFPDEQIRLQTGSTGSEYKLLCSIFVNGHLQGRNYGTK